MRHPFDDQPSLDVTKLLLDADAQSNPHSKVPKAQPIEAPSVHSIASRRLRSIENELGLPLGFFEDEATSDAIAAVASAMSQLVDRYLTRAR